MNEELIERIRVLTKQLTDKVYRLDYEQGVDFKYLNASGQLRDLGYTWSEGFEAHPENRKAICMYWQWLHRSLLLCEHRTAYEAGLRSFGPKDLETTLMNSTEWRIEELTK
jgi:hypothetical protein